MQHNILWVRHHRHRRLHNFDILAEGAEAGEGGGVEGQWRVNGVGIPATRSMAKRCFLTLVPIHCAVNIFLLSSFLPWIVTAGASAQRRRRAGDPLNFWAACPGLGALRKQRPCVGEHAHGTGEAKPASKA